MKINKKLIGRHVTITTRWGNSVSGEIEFINHGVVKIDTNYIQASNIVWISEEGVKYR